MVLAILTLTILSAAFGLLLGYAAKKFHIEGDPIADKIDQLLPQTQCGQCGYPGCRPYAEAIANETDELNKCAPGGQETVVAIADLLGREPIALDESIEEKEPAIAFIVEKDCIGCTLCIQACPVDAILGAAKQMHTVIESECTGCELCLPPCPVECIKMLPHEVNIDNWAYPMPQESL